MKIDDKRAQIYATYLKRCLQAMVGASEEVQELIVRGAEAVTPDLCVKALEEEYDELERRQMTPTMEMIIQAVHDEAGRCDSELTSPIFVRVDPHDYDALCDEEAAREATTQKGGSSE
jgi:hypothetical protein